MAKLSKKKNGNGKLSGFSLSIPLTLARRMEMIDRELEIIECEGFIIVRNVTVDDIKAVEDE